jgi:hypothetical protein
VLREIKVLKVIRDHKVTKDPKEIKELVPKDP